MNVKTRSIKVRVDVCNQIADGYDNADSAIAFHYTHKAMALAKTIDYNTGISDVYYEIDWSVMQITSERMDLFRKTSGKSITFGTELPSPGTLIIFKLPLQYV